MARSLTRMVARRYFFSKNNRSFINVISGISVSAVAVGTMMLIIVLSVFNGLEELIRSLFASFDPDIQITVVEGKSFLVTDEWLDSLSAVEGVGILTEVLEDNALLRYRDGQQVVKVKGVGESFLEHNRMENVITQGELKLREDRLRYAIVGRGIQYALGISPQNDFYALQFFYPKASRPGAFTPTSQMYTSGNLLPGGIFAIEKQYDENYVFVPLDFAEELFNTQSERKRTSVEIMVAEGYSVASVQRNLRAHLGDSFQVLNSDEQHASLLRAIQTEKLIVYLVFFLVLAVASFNIFFSLSMLAIEKKRDISVLYAMGATDGLIRKIFLLEGGLIALVGGGVGLILGFLVTWAQKTFGIVKMGMTAAVMDDYPVELEAQDFMYSVACIVLITLLASLRPAKIATRTSTLENL
ncbi:MAG TPA: hypothetical protein DCE41_09290 [Cytophagales bacterium]|nr:hypothetical protein [Cytophagales bacterium]HAA21247.1 hypothetical protein [Cytophagales bacterium]HAP62435.1 hypothetical protein [Cytophagales bacterium]